MSGKYILDNLKPVPCDDLMRWARWIETSDRRIERTMIGSIKVSTVFLGIDHNYCDDGPPILFETMVFGGAHDQEQYRYSTLAEAKTGHFKIVRMVAFARNPLLHVGELLRKIFKTNQTE